MRILVLLGLVLITQSCTSMDEVNAKEFPDCWHNSRAVMDKCIELNKSGEKINAYRVEQMLRDGLIK